MAYRDTMNLPELLCRRLEEVDADLPREMMMPTAQALMDAEVTSICGAEYRERADERTTRGMTTAGRPLLYGYNATQGYIILGEASDVRGWPRRPGTEGGPR